MSLPERSRASRGQAALLTTMASSSAPSAEMPQETRLRRFRLLFVSKPLQRPLMPALPRPGLQSRDRLCRLVLPPSISTAPRAGELPIPSGPGSKLSFTSLGLAPHCLPAAFAATAAAAAASAAAPAPPPLDSATEAAFRRYALLVWVLQGNSIENMQRLLSDDWQLESMAVQLKDAPAGHSSRARNAAYWRTAVDPASGRTYYYHELTWQVSWYAPSV